MRRGAVQKGSAWALVTGGNSGIGRCYVRRLAALGYNVFIAGIDGERNRETAGEVRAECGVEVVTMEIDLARREAARELYDAVRERGIEVSVLVNNAGMFSYLDVLKTPEERLDRLVLLHSYTPTMLCRLFGADMAARGKGHILNMSSYSLWMPWPGLATYSASKSYLRNFSVAFSKEVQECGVKVTSVCPAGVATDLYGLPANLQKLGIRLGVLLTPDGCARRALRAMWRGRRNSVPGWWNRLGIPFCVWMPMLVLRIARKYTRCLQR